MELKVYFPLRPPTPNPLPTEYLILYFVNYINYPSFKDELEMWPFPRDQLK
jgi:hypothetical protein